MTVRAALKAAARGTIYGMADGPLWRELGEGVLALLILALRIVFLLTFPVSVPLIAWIIIEDDIACRAKHAAAAERMRASMHRNGR